MRFPRMAAVSAAALAGAVLLAGCGADEATAKKDPAPKTKTGTLEELAAMTTCKPQVQVDADELRQGVCKTPRGRFVLTTFASSKGQKDWLIEAKPYGGSYLVGKKWIAVGEPALLQKLRGNLGGTMESGSHGGNHGGAAEGGSGGDTGGAGEAPPKKKH